MNFTLDDSAPQLAYSPTWDTQSSKDPDLLSFFQSTYHTAVADGATVNITFSGTFWPYSTTEIVICDRIFHRICHLSLWLQRTGTRT